MLPLETPVQEFLNRTLGEDGLKVFPLAGDASNRRYYRVVREHNSWVLMRWDPFEPDNYPFLSVLRHFKNAGARVPEVIGMDPGVGVVLLEDLGDLTLERRFWESRSQDDSLVFYRMAIDQMIRIHHHATALKGPCTAFQIKFDTEKLLWEMNYGKDNLINGVLKHQPPASRAAELQKAFTDICLRLDQEPKKIAHRDYHSRNLMIKLDEMIVIDFQDARLGPVQYDLVSLLRDSYTNLDERMCGILIDDYLGKSKEFLPKDFSKEHFLRIYELQSVQRCFKACGSFASFYHQRQDRRYLKYLMPTLKRVFKALNSFPEYKIMADVLIDSGALEKNYDSL
ncbi:MAG: phosphotransferase [Bdellovibrionaceae bacterium]|nr:phosphotransferase [Pseudobdellovibrionaceae bacterium]MBX3033764.1 phosphotransferase [Pseudobdellovibrionaceae bacterium]